MSLFPRGLDDTAMPLSRTSSTSFLKYDNSTMVTSRNLQCMPSDDEEDDLNEEEDNEYDDDDDDDNLILCDTIKHSFTSINSEQRRHKDNNHDNTKKLADHGIRDQQQTKSTITHRPHLQQQKHQYRHSIGLPIKNNHHLNTGNHIKTSASHPVASSSSKQHRHHHHHSHHLKSGLPIIPLLSMDPTTPPLTPTTPTSTTTTTTTNHHHHQQQQQYLRHRSSLSGVDLIMAREQLEQKKKKNKPKKKWDSTRAPIGGLLAQLPQQGQHTISFQQQQLQLQQQMQTIPPPPSSPFPYQQQPKRNSQLMLPPSLLVLPRSPTSNMSRW